jgi:hypothetical protein
MEIVPLYSHDGGPPKAYQCARCNAVTKTAVGIDRHLWQKHKVRLQLDLFEKPILSVSVETPNEECSPDLH